MLFLLSLIACSHSMILIVQISSSTVNRYRFDSPKTVAEVIDFIRDHHGSSHILLFDPGRNRYLGDGDVHEYCSRIIAHVEQEDNQPVLGIAGPAFPLDSLVIAGRRVRFAPPSSKQDSEELDGCTGLVTWDGAVVLAKYLEVNPHWVKEKTVLELGSGTGLGAISAYLLGCDLVVCTDLPYALDSLRHNLRLNVDLQDLDSKVKVQSLDWKDVASYPKPFLYPPDGLVQSTFENRWDLIIAADVVWLDHLVRPLVDTLAALCGSQTTIILSYQVSLAT